MKIDKSNQQHKFPDAKFSKGEIKQRISVKLRRHKANNKKVCYILSVHCNVCSYSGGSSGRVNEVSKITIGSSINSLCFEIGFICFCFPGC